MTCMIRPMTRQDADTVLAIYAEGIATYNATFDTEPGSWEMFDKRFLPACRLVAKDGGKVVGWAVLSAASARPVYRGVAEVSVYIGAGERGKGFGKALMAALIEAAEDAGFWTLQGHIFPENEASLKLHAQFGFQVVGTRERFGLMSAGPLAGQWRDVTLMERRSTVVGAD